LARGEAVDFEVIFSARH